MSKVPDIESIKKAEEYLSRFLGNIPPLYSYKFSEKFFANIFIKPESLFSGKWGKWRGLVYKLLRLKEDKYVIPCDKECVTIATSGKIPFSASLFLIVPEGIKKNISYPENIRIIEVKEDINTFAKTYSKENNLSYIDIYEDNDIIAGYGTVALEFLRDEKSLEIIIVPVRHGRLVSGIGIFTKEVLPHVKVYGIYKNGSLNLNETTSHIIEKYTDGLLPVEEEFIEMAKTLCAYEFGKMPEEKSLLPLAILFKREFPLKNKSLGLVI